MALQALTVYRSGKKWDSKTNHSTAVTWGASDDAIKVAIPSVCKTDVGTHGLVNSLVIVDSGEPNNPYHLYCNQTAAEVAALDDS